jgi:hypothetical protein
MPQNRLEASFAMMPRASSCSHWNSNRVLSPKPKKYPPVILRPKPPNRLEKCIRYVSSTILTHVTVILDHPIIKSSCAFVWLGQLSSWLGQHGILFLMYSCLLMSPSVSSTNGQSSGHLGPSVRALHPSFTAPSPSVWHVSTWPYPCPSTVSVFHTCTLTQPRNMHVAHTLTQWLVSKLNQSRSSPHNHLSQLYTKRAHISLMSTPLFLSCVLVWVLRAQRWQGWREQMHTCFLSGGTVGILLPSIFSLDAPLYNCKYLLYIGVIYVVSGEP